MSPAPARSPSPDPRAVLQLAKELDRKVRRGVFSVALSEDGSDEALVATLKPILDEFKPDTLPRSLPALRAALNELGLSGEAVRLMGCITAPPEDLAWRTNPKAMQLRAERAAAARAAWPAAEADLQRAMFDLADFQAEPRPYPTVDPRRLAQAARVDRACSTALLLLDMLLSGLLLSAVGVGEASPDLPTWLLPLATGVGGGFAAHRLLRESISRADRRVGGRAQLRHWYTIGALLVIAVFVLPRLDVIIPPDDLTDPLLALIAGSGLLAMVIATVALAWEAAARAVRGERRARIAREVQVAQQDHAEIGERLAEKVRLAEAKLALLLADMDAVGLEEQRVEAAYREEDWRLQGEWIVWEKKAKIDLCSSYLVHQLLGRISPAERSWVVRKGIGSPEPEVQDIPEPDKPEPPAAEPIRPWAWGLILAGLGVVGAILWLHGGVQ